MLIALSDVLALLDAVAAEPGTYAEGGVNRQKVWLSEPSLSRLKARVAALPQATPTAPAALVEGLDAQGWYETARRYYVGLKTIVKTEGHGIDRDWCRRQADYYLGHAQDGSQVWQMPGAPEMHHIVVPDAALALPRRVQPAPPIATIAAGEEVTLEIRKPENAGGIPNADAG